MRVYAQQGDTLDLLCWRHLQRTADVVERVLDANVGLVSLGPVLPHGTPIDLPEPATLAPAANVLVQLWD